MVATAVNTKLKFPRRTTKRDKTIDGTIRKRKTATSTACSLWEA
jgi:hypothetical protein